VQFSLSYYVYFTVIIKIKERNLIKLWYWKGKILKAQFLLINQFTPLFVFVHMRAFRCAIITIGIRACFDSYSNISKMVGQNQTFVEGASINRPLLFAGDYHLFWKGRMQIFLESVDKGVWDVVVNGQFN